MKNLFVTILLIASVVSSCVCTPLAKSNRDLAYHVTIYAVEIHVHHCNGVILSSFWILTAARCVYDFNAQSLTVQYGEHGLTIPQRNTIREKVIHPDYGYADYFTNNLAMLLTKKRIEFIPKVIAPIVLQSYPVEVDEMVMITGWRWDYVS